MDLTEILWWSAGIFLLGILAGAVGMYRVQRKERSRELKKISDTVQRMTSGKELPDFSDCEETMDSKIRHQLLRLQEILVSQKQDAQKERKELQAEKNLVKKRTRRASGGKTSDERNRKRISAKNFQRISTEIFKTRRTTVQTAALLIFISYF